MLRSKASALLASIALLATLTHAGSAGAQDVGEPTAPGRDTRMRFTQAEISVRTAFIRDSGYDPYDANDALTQLSLALSRTVYSMGDLSFAVGARWDWGGTSDTARGAKSSIFVHRLGVPLEARWHFMPWLYGFARVAPSLTNTSATVHDDALGVDLSGDQWAFGADLSLGAAVLIGPHSAPTSHLPRWWATVDGGYGWNPRKPMELAADSSSDGPRYGATSMPSLAMRGGFFRLGIALTL